MATCCIPGCVNELRPGGKLRTCQNCRHSLHAWEKRRPAEILERTRKLNLYRARMSTFSVIADDDTETVEKINRKDLAEQGIMYFPKRKPAKRSKR